MRVEAGVGPQSPPTAWRRKRCIRIYKSTVMRIWGSKRKLWGSEEKSRNRIGTTQMRSGVRTRVGVRPQSLQRRDQFSGQVEFCGPFGGRHILKVRGPRVIQSNSEVRVFWGFSLD